MAMPTPNLSPSRLARNTRTPSLMDQYNEVRAVSVALARPLSPEDCQVQSMPDASPVKWHLAHTTWFFETFILSVFKPNYVAYSPAYRVLFNSYYNAIGEKHPRAARGMLSRPPLSDVLAYREHVDQAMRALYASHSHAGDELDGLMRIGINHEQQHQELILTDVKHMLSCNPLAPAYLPPSATRLSAGGDSGAAPAIEPLTWTEFAGGVVSIGYSPDADDSADENTYMTRQDAASDARAPAAIRTARPAFTFDNESPRHQVFLQPYSLANRLVTQGEYLAFMRDGGYERAELWLSAGWDTVAAQGWIAPMYWSKDGDAWRQFTLHGLRDLDLNAPVTHISYFEADAYARWSGARLPKEAEWEHAAALFGEPDADRDNLQESGHYAPVAARPGQGMVQLFGDAWEWTSSSYEAYPGFRTPEGAVGEYNGKFMCNQYVLRGGSCVTPASHLRATYRNFFPTDARWQFSGIRLARHL